VPGGRLRIASVRSQAALGAELWVREGSRHGHSVLGALRRSTGTRQPIGREAQGERREAGREPEALRQTGRR